MGQKIVKTKVDGRAIEISRNTDRLGSDNISYHSLLRHSLAVWQEYAKGSISVHRGFHEKLS